MLPTTVNSDVDILSTADLPSYTYAFASDTRIMGYVDEVEAMKQAIEKILCTERYQYIIYSWNYGVETADLYGMPSDYVVSELTERITEALVQDTRITDVSDFVFDTNNKHSIECKFTVQTIFGDIKAQKEVEV